MDQNLEKSYEKISFETNVKKFLNELPHERGSISWYVSSNAYGMGSNLYISDCHNTVGINMSPTGGYDGDVEEYKKSFEERSQKLETLLSNLLAFKEAMYKGYEVSLEAISERIKYEKENPDAVSSEV